MLVVGEQHHWETVMPSFPVCGQFRGSWWSTIKTGCWIRWTFCLIQQDFSYVFINLLISCLKCGNSGRNNLHSDLTFKGKFTHSFFFF